VTDEVVALLQQLVGAVNGLRIDLRRHYRNDSATRWELRARLLDAFARDVFSTTGVSWQAEDDPDLYAVLERCGVDMDTDERSRSTQIGMLISGLPWVERIGTQSGAALFRLADL
jgi:hypothetical protein